MKSLNLKDKYRASGNFSTSWKATNITIDTDTGSLTWASWVELLTTCKLNYSLLADEIKGKEYEFTSKIII